jgi:hypothetical protein
VLVAPADLQLTAMPAQEAVALQALASLLPPPRMAALAAGQTTADLRQQALAPAGEPLVLYLVCLLGCTR